MILYHASDVPNIDWLRPQISNEGKYVYLSKDKAHILAYLVNPIRKFCIDNNIEPEEKGVYYRWAIRDWDKEKGVPYIFECWSGMFDDTYKNTPSYFYKVEKNDDCEPLMVNGKMKFSSYYVSSKPIKVTEVEVIEDTLEFFKKLEKEGRLKLARFEELDEANKKRVHDNAVQSYEMAKTYKMEHLIKFLESKFDFLKNKEHNCYRGSL